MAQRSLIWDAPLRIVHWLLVVLVAFSWWSAENHELGWHKLSGYALLTLVLFRIAWGFVGSVTARFSQFIHSPRTVAAYARHLLDRNVGNSTVGHTPTGGWSIVLMLLLLLLQPLLGFFAVDVDGIESGPLAHWVSFETGRRVADWHEFIFNLLLALIVLHIAAVLFYLLYRRENLITPMLTGTRATSADSLQVRNYWMRAVVVVALAAVSVWLLVNEAA